MNELIGARCMVKANLHYLLISTFCAKESAFALFLLYN